MRWSAFMRAYRDAAKPAELGGVRLVAERARDQHVEVGVGGLAGGGHQVGAGDGAELRADEDAGAAFGADVRVAFDVAPLGADQVTRPRRERGEGDAVLTAGLLDAGRVQVLQDHGREVLLPVVAGLGLGEMVDQLVILVDAERAVRRQTLHRERTGDAEDSPIAVGLVVQVLEVGLGDDGGVALLLPRDAGASHQRRCRWVAQLAMSWVLGNPAVTVALVGIGRTEELKENVAAVEWRSSPDERQEIDTIFAEEGDPTHSETPEITEPFLPAR